MEGLRKGYVWIFFLTQSRQYIQKIIAHQNPHRIIVLILIHIYEHFPIGRIAIHHLCKGFSFILCKLVPVSFSRSYLQSIVQKNFMNLSDVSRKFIFISALICCMRTNDPQHEFMLWHCLNILMHPGRNSSKGIGVTSLQN